MRWKQAVREALKRYCRRHKSRVVVHEILVHEELGHIKADTQTRGKTPDATLRRELQELRDLGEVDFVDNHGTYKYLGDF